ncbi:molybdenum cofactor guanylyltransferase [Desulfosporosinus sp. FKB]|uniref:molybdenum cofactor guanylyltransferase n=1 Tax=Desulfosporosinus sp. FKB TaxID=1969835 RepID=UPI000B4A3904|nr:molybdenum cofactor guanylyltransferase [Desulfosporosinus sp. FKB]
MILQDTIKRLPKLEATGVLLAGGKNSRMKKNKAFLELEGKPLVERTLDVLEDTFSEVLISSNEPELYKDYNFSVIQDEHRDQGPLAGLYQGLKAADNPSVFFVACDMPFLQGELIRFLFRWAPDYDVVVPRFQSVIHPLHAFYHRNCLPEIKKNLEAGRLKITDLFSACSIKYVEETELTSFSGLDDVFCNVNTPQEWLNILK